MKRDGEVLKCLQELSRVADAVSQSLSEQAIYKYDELVLKQADRQYEPI